MPCGIIIIIMVFVVENDEKCVMWWNEKKAKKDARAKSIYITWRFLISTPCNAIVIQLSMITDDRMASISYQMHVSTPQLQP